MAVRRLAGLWWTASAVAIASVLPAAIARGDIREVPSLERIVSLLPGRRGPVGALGYPGTGSRRRIPAVHAAVLHRDHASLGRLLEAGEDPNLVFAGTTPLLQATWRNDADLASLLLQYGAHTEARDQVGVTALLVAADRGKTAIARLLVEHGAEVNATDPHGASVLAKAVSSGDTELVGLLLDHGAEVNTRDDQGYTPLWHAGSRGYGEVARLLVDYGAEMTLDVAIMLGDVERVEGFLNAGADINAPDPVQGSPPLHRAAFWGQLEVAKLLISRGANIHRTANADLPLLIAAGRAGPELVRILLDRGVPVNSRNRHGDTALHRAAQGGELETVGLLLERGADPRIADRGGATPLHRTNRPAVAELLLEHGADINARDSSGCTPLHRAGFWGGSQLVEFLLERGADPNARDSEGRTPLFRQWDSERAYELLMEYGADVNAQDDAGWTPVVWKAVHGSSQEVRAFLARGAPFSLEVPVAQGDSVKAHELLDAGADPNARLPDGEPLLVWAAGHTSSRIVRLLLQHGADPQATAPDDWTALHAGVTARFEGVEDTITSLLDAGADINAPDQYGQTPLLIATALGQRRLARVLLERGAAYQVDHAILLGDEATVTSFLRDGDPDFRSAHGRTLLHCAVIAGRPETASLLLRHGAEINARDRDGLTPLTYSTFCCRPCFDLLKARGGTE